MRSRVIAILALSLLATGAASQDSPLAACLAIAATAQRMACHDPIPPTAPAGLTRTEPPKVIETNIAGQSRGWWPAQGEDHDDQGPGPAGRRQQWRPVRVRRRNQTRLRQDREQVMPRFECAALMSKFQDMVRRREPIVGGGVGTGISAKCEEAAGIVTEQRAPGGEAASTVALGSVDRGLQRLGAVLRPPTVGARRRP